jgi:hypothetical protein
MEGTVFLVILLIVLEGLLVIFQPMVLLIFPACVLAITAAVVTFEVMKRNKLSQLKSKAMMSELLKPTYFNNKLTWNIDDAKVELFGKASRELAIAAGVGLFTSFVTLQMSTRVYDTYQDVWSAMMADAPAITMLGFIFTMIIFFAIAAQLTDPFNVFKLAANKAVKNARLEAESVFTEKLDKLHKSTDDVAQEAAGFGVVFRRAYDAEIVTFIQKNSKELYLKQKDFVQVIDRVAEGAEDDLEKLMKVRRRYDAAKDLLKSVGALVKKSGTLSHMKQLESIDQLLQSEKLMGFLPDKQWQEFADSLKQLAGRLKTLREDVKNPREPETTEIKKRKFPKFGR